MRVWEIGSGPAPVLRRRWTPIRSKRRPGSPLIGPLAHPVRAFHPQPAGTAPGDDGGGMSFAMRTRLYAARAARRRRCRPSAPEGNNRVPCRHDHLRLPPHLEAAAGGRSRHGPGDAVPARSNPPASPRPTSTATSAYRVRRPARPARDGARSRTGCARATPWSSWSWPASGTGGPKRSTRSVVSAARASTSLAEGESTWACYLEADEDSPDRYIGELLRREGSRSGARGNPTSDESRPCPRKGEGKTLGRPWAGPDALRQLAAQQQLGGASYGEIAKNLNVGRSTVRNWLRRAGGP